MTTILSIVPYKIFPAKLGGQKGIALFNEYLAREVKLVCVTIKSNEPSYAKGYLLLNLLSDSPLRYINPFYVLKLRKILRQHQATHLLLEHPYYGWLGILLKWITGVRLIIHSHNIESTRWQTLGKWWWKILWHYEKLSHRAADYNFFIQDDDRQFAISNFKLDAARCTTITYGIELAEAPPAEERQRCKTLLQEQHQIATGYSLLLFNGTLDYLPNLNALKIILNTVNPALINSGLLYKIIICGRGLPAEMNNLASYADKNIIYAGFTDDISIYFKGVDIFINPVVDGGGIKTKLVETIGFGTLAVSTQSGSIGITPNDAGDLLKITGDDEWGRFVTEVLQAFQQTAPTVPEVFFQKFYWGNIAKKAAAFIE